MKKIRNCKVAVFLLIGWICLSAAGYLGKDGIYKKYTIDTAKTPYFVLVLQGLHDHVYPWEQNLSGFPKHYPDTLPDQVLAKEPDDTQSTEKKETETATEMESTTEKETVTETDQQETAKQFVMVDESYFDDAVFIGDSRTVGLHDYSGLDGADFFATVGMNVYHLWTEKFCVVNGKKVTLEEALRAKQNGKVYFQIGINEMGSGTIDTFMNAYEDAVKKMQQLQPNAIIYVQGIMKVTKEKSDSDPIFNNEGITARNERIAALADGKKIFYIDVNEVVCDENGGLKESLTFDNLHLYGSKYDIWVDFLKSKGIEM